MRRTLFTFACCLAACSLFSHVEVQGGVSNQDFALSGVPGMEGIPGLETVGEDSPVLGSSLKASVSSFNDQSFILVAEVNLAEAWHAYFSNPGTVGLPVEASMKPVPGFTVKGPFWALPTRAESDLGVFYGYTNPKAAFIVTPTEQAGNEAEFSVDMTFQACRDGQCLSPETRTVMLKLPRGTGEQEPGAAILQKDIVGIQTPTWAIQAQFTANLQITEKREIVRLSFTGVEDKVQEGGNVYFFSIDGEIMPTEKQNLKKGEDGKWTLEMVRNLNEDSLYPNKRVGEDGELLPMERLKGILAVRGQGIQVDVPVETEEDVWNAPIVTERAANWETESLSGTNARPGIFMIAMLLFLGGLILNLMPCVFPVLGLKVLSFVQLGGGDRYKVFTHALTFVLGVLVSFWSITGILIALKSGVAGNGGMVNWAFWMENQWVIYCLMLLMLVLGMSMFGLFEIGVGATGIGSELQNRKGYAGSFWSGVLATVVATPCSAPFLGGAIAPALSLPTWGMFIVFTCMGLGMAFPYVILGAFPSLVKYLPKPGAWMESFKQGLSFCLFGAAAWLLWVYSGSFLDAGSILYVMLGVVCIGCAGWIYGKWCPMYRSQKSRVWGTITAVIVGGCGIWMSLPESSSSVEENIEEMGIVQDLEWKKWSSEAVQEALKAGHPVYVDFTARWCLTCQVNKKVAYSDEVKQIIRSREVVLLKADKTRPNPEIDAALRALNRSSVPVNVLYVPGDPEPKITAEVLTPGYLVDFFNTHLQKR